MTKSKNTSFFEKYASEYDAMTEAHLREPKHRVEVQAMMARFSPKYILDAGCGTGLTTRLFGSMGVDAMGVDSSIEMIKLAEESSRKDHSGVQFLNSQFESLPKELNTSFDLVVCIGNSISGVPTDASLDRTFRSFRRALKPSGWLVLQMLNPAVIKQGETFGVKVSRSGDRLYHRYATRPDDRVFLHVVRTDLSASQPAFEAFVHSYRLLTAAQFKARLHKAGFDRVAAFASLTFAPVAKASPSRDLVMIARRTS
jgi:ubiquinone/menaquinone biosynthesis C-methylase UbiE